MPNNNCQKIFPPYGRQLFTKLQSDCMPINDIFLFIGGKLAWKLAKHHKNSGLDVLVLPENTDPKNFIWPIENCSILAFDKGQTNYQGIRRLAFCLLRAKASVVRVVLSNLEVIIFSQEDKPC